jgi:peroxiredoxin
MKQKILIIALVCMFCFRHSNAQSTKTGSFVINGHIDGIENGTKVYLHDVDAQSKIDSAVSSNGNFTLKGHVEKPTTCWIECKDQYAIIQVENTKMEFESPLTNMRLYGIAKGGKEQDLQNELTKLQHPYEVVFFTAYDSLTKKQYVDKEHEKRLAKKLNDYQDTAQNIYVEFGKSHPNSYLGLDILYRNRQRIGKDSIEILLSQLDEPLKTTTKAQGLILFALGELAQKGKKFIDFEVDDIYGQSFKLSSLQGNYILLSFWNASCGPCRRENKKISNDYNRLKNKISFVSFSTDKVKSSWLKASKVDNILWTNVSDLKGDNGKIKTQYNVQAIPTSFLINKEGIVVQIFIGLDEDFLNQLEKLIALN